MIRKVLIFVFIFIGVIAGSAFADCPVPQLTIVDQHVYYTGDQILLRVNHTQGAMIDFKFDYRNINVHLFGPDLPYQTDNSTKVTNLSVGDTLMGGQVVENQSGQWRGYARARCTLGQSNKMTPPPTAMSGWSTPVEFTVLDKGSNGIFASVRTDPASYVGACPKAISAYARIQSHMPGKAVTYSWLVSDRQTAPGGNLTFSSPGIQDIGPEGFPVGGQSSNQYKDPPHSGAIFLIVNGQKALAPSATYQVTCTLSPVIKTPIINKKFP